MSTEILGILVMFTLSVLLAIPFGKYIAKVYKGDKTLLDPVFGPIERICYRISGIDPKTEMNWKQHMSGYFGVTVPPISVKWCHFERYCNNS